MITKDFDLDDVFTISEIIDKMGIEADIGKITRTIQASKLENKSDLTGLGKEVAVSIGVDLITKMIRNLFKARKEVKKLISDLTEKPISEVSKMGLKDIKEFFTELFNHEGVGDFLAQAGASDSAT